MSLSMFGPAPRLGGGESVPDWARKLAPLGARKLRVIWDISNKCNLRCRMCHFSFDDVFYREADFTTPENFRRLAAEILPLAHTLTLSAGNEPLVSPHFAAILRIVAEYRVPTLYFITNAQRLTAELAEVILECGVTQVQVSIDGSTRETYEHIRRGASFDRLVANLSHLAARKRALGRTLPQLQFNIVLMRRNIAELEGFVDLAESVGVEWIAARHLLMMKGLGMESETLFPEPAYANACMRRFLERVGASRSVKVVGFPDFFAETSAVTEAAAPVAAPPSPEVPTAVTGDKPPVPADSQPIGWLDLPAGLEVVADNAVHFEGWALDRNRIDRVVIERQALPGEGDASSRIELGEARITNGTRPDVGQVHPDYPDTYRAGWTYQLRREALPPGTTAAVEIVVRAISCSGASTCIGTRVVRFAEDTSAAVPYLFCARPFDSVYLDSSGNVYPYPDCRPQRPFGSLKEPGITFSEIWFGEAFTGLRAQVIERKPPEMCLSCAYFINRNVDDEGYFTPR